MTQLLALLGITAGQVMRGEKIKLNKSERLRVLSAAGSLGILHLMYNALTAEFQPEDIPASFVVNEIKTVFENTAQADIWQKMCDAFENNGVDIMMLKGIHLRELYPDPESRAMCDIDLLFRYGEKRKVKKTVEELGFSFYGADRHHLKFYNKQSVTVELHHTIRQVWNYDDPYFENLFERSGKLDGYKHIYKMSLEDLYIHTVLHLNHHIDEGEFAFRRLCDIYMLSLKCDVECEYVKSRLESLKMTEFADNLNKVCRYIFEGISADDDIAELAEMFSGCREKTDSEAADERVSAFSKLKYFISELFPKPAKIYVSFPWVFYHRCLLPVGYIVRIFQGLGSRKEYAVTKVNSAAEFIKREGESEFNRKYGVKSEK